MDFSLMLSPQQTELQLAESRNAILATNQLSFTMYGMQLTEDEAAMIVEAGSQAMQEEELVEFGTGIVPRLIHWFLPTGYLGMHYAQKLAALSEAFYHIKGRLQAITEEAGDNGCTLSDNAVIYYMYNLFVSPSCAGDIDVMADQAEQIICGAMQRLLDLRAAQRKAHQTVLAGSEEYRALYADVILDEYSESDMEQRSAAEIYDDTYSRAMESVRYAAHIDDGDDGEMPEYGTYAEELEAVLRRSPALLIPSRRAEAEWDSMTEEWEESDAAAAEAAAKAAAEAAARSAAEKSVAEKSATEKSVEQPPVPERKEP